MADAALQLLLDPDVNGNGIQILKRDGGASVTNTSYYCQGRVYGVGKSLWVDVVTANTDAQKNTSIRAAFGVA